jgi:hypothetical protein
LVTFVGPELHEIFGLSVIIINLNEWVEKNGKTIELSAITENSGA